MLASTTVPPAAVRAASTAVVDDATTLLAALRRRPLRALPPSIVWLSAASPFLLQPDSAGLILALLQQAGVLEGPPWRPRGEATREFLDAGRGQAQQLLLQAWLESSWNDLATLPGLAAPGEAWPNDPRLPRRAVL